MKDAADLLTVEDVNRALAELAVKAMKARKPIALQKITAARQCLAELRRGLVDATADEKLDELIKSNAELEELLISKQSGRARRASEAATFGKILPIVDPDRSWGPTGHDGNGGDAA